jgi:YhcH/YjgK/YiaL family protein
MILDRLERVDRYTNLCPNFSRAFKFLKETSLEKLDLGKHEIEGKRVYAVVFQGPATPREEAKLEAHRKYIDVQVVLSGTDEMGWKNKGICTQRQSAYDAESDVEFFSDPPDAWIPVGPGAFAIFFPEDAHAPAIGSGELHKVILKVATE